MRLLEVSDGYTFSVTKDLLGDDEIPAYAILSHTWQAGQEVTFDDLIKDNKTRSSKVRSSLRLLRPRSSKAGYAKLRFCAQQAKLDGLRYFWVDTCCIDKANPVELQDAINSMFRWYRDAAKCYVFLSDVSIAGQKGSSESSVWKPAFEHSRWFTRGWTLQELLAPRVVTFFSQEGKYLGDRLELKQQIHDITKIPVRALSGAPLVEFSINERLSWAAERHTTRKEDKAYSLLGLFGIHLPPIYGEGYEHAFGRLLKGIAETQGGTLGHDYKTTRVPLWTVPFRRDDDFITRDSLGAIRQICTRPAARAALVGLGGVGKSQVAIEYAYQMRDKSPMTWVFWVHAETQARFREGYRRIAEATKMDGWNDTKADPMRLVRNWLCDESNGRWVMVVDNADDADVLFHNTPQRHDLDPLSAEPLADFLPQTSTGSIVVTSRNRDVAYKLTGDQDNIVEVKPMNNEEAFALLYKKFGSSVRRDEAVALIHALESMPLALTQAAAFIKQRAPRMSISRYLKDIRKSNHDRARLLEKDMGDSRRDGRASNSIIATWQISFTYLRERKPSAAQLLSLMSLFDRQGIPELLLQNTYRGNGNEVDFEDDIHTLTSFSLVEMSADGSSFEMHGLVQFSTKKWLELCNELEYWKETYVALMDESYPVGRPENWPICQALFPHAQAALDNLPLNPEAPEALEAWASISYKASWYMGEMGEFNKAYKLALDAFEVREILLGAEDPDTVDSLNVLGVALHRLGRYNEAKAIHERALDTKKRTIGMDHVDTLISVLNLASTCNNQGEWADAERLLSQMLEAASRMELEADHPLTLSTLSVLATTYIHLERWTDAEKLKLQVLAAKETKLGATHPTTLTLKGDLAYIYRQQGRLKDAEELGLEVLRNHETMHVAETELLTSMAHLAGVYKAQGRLKEAEKLEVHVMATSKAKLGIDHPDTLYSIGNLAITYWRQGRFEEAQELQAQVLELRKAKFGENHPSTLDSKVNLATTYRSQGLLKESEELALEVLETRKAKLVADHNLVLEAQANLASTYREQGRFADAQKLEEQVLQVCTEKLGKDHLDTLGGMGNLAITCYRQGFIDKAMELTEKCYQGHDRVLGPEHPYTIKYKERLEKWQLEGSTGS